MSKHTPGPWVVVPLKGKYYGTEIHLGGKEHINVWTPNHHASQFASEREIANGWEPSDGHDHVEDAQSYANALLVATAPELLEACNALLDAEDEKDDSMARAMLLGCAVEMARAAIAKARGEA